MKKIYVIVGDKLPIYDNLEKAEADARKVLQHERGGSLWVAEVRSILWVGRKLEVFEDEVGEEV